MTGNVRKLSKLDQLNIVCDCEVTQIKIDFVTDKAKLVTIARCTYTPRAIAKVLKKYNLLIATWIIGPTGKELWKLDGELAKQL